MKLEQKLFLQNLGYIWTHKHLMKKMSTTHI